MDNIDEVDLKPPTDTGFNNELFSVEHVKQENNVLEENLNEVSSDIKLEPDIQIFEFINIEDNKHEKHIQTMVASEENLEMVKESNESEKNVYRCSICSYRTTRKFCLTNHKKSHLALEERQMFACAHCDNKYKTRGGLQYHLDNNHIDFRTKELKKPQEKIYRCAICSYRTEHKSCLKRHEKIHLAPEERQSFACVLCDKKYLTKVGLKDHFKDNHIDSSPIDTAYNNELFSVEHVKQENDVLEENLNDVSSDIKLELPTDTAFNNESFSVEHVKQENNVLEENLNGVSSDIKLEPPTDTAFNNESFSVEHVKQENDVLEENLNGISSDIKLEPDIQTFEFINYEDNKHEKHIQAMVASEDNLEMAKASNESQKKVYRCSTCNYKTARKFCLTNHKKSHLALEERQMFACAHCDSKYKTRGGLQYHLDNNHIDPRTKELKKPPEKTYRCAVCHYRTEHKSCLWQHEKIHLAPGERESFVCVLCDKKYLTKGGLKDHLKYYHIDSKTKELNKSKKKVYGCPTCSHQAGDMSALRRHQAVHLTPEERQMYGCAHCDKKYMSKSDLRRHFEAKHTRSKEVQEKVYKCGKCHYETLRRSYFTKHEQVHLAPEERQMFACEQCDKKYMSNCRLQDHVKRNHTESRLKESQKKFRCSICSHKSRDMANIRRHEVIHLTLEERQMFGCAHCGRKYRSKKGLQDHLKRAHIDSGNADCISPADEKFVIDEYTPHLDDFRNVDCASPTDEVIIDSLKIEMDELTSLLNDTKYRMIE
ncbi:PR domain zinc finger protein 5-like isoform X2 [Sitophilus oryzae]|uniref:PR domain zinc finger protein 5-like isoform X2 n=1 Tax=Sitophilus oryzae TaxID=7048 RepID=A0A6J2XNQ7_SITOR|nr:PR domain zinc finger protein 5-like isoform X2 [Sitophilus oryzae]